jgi:hypothetical protein
MTGRGFALVDTPPSSGDRLLPRLSGGRTVLTVHDKRWRRLPRLACYAAWLEGLLGEALPEEAVALASLELRHEPAGSEDPEVDRLHADGSYVRSVYTLYGPATIYRDGAVERPVPDGQTLLMTALGRARAVRVPCTLHRRPGAGPERALVVCSFEPRTGQAPPANAYREVVHAHGRSSRLRRGRFRYGLRDAKVWDGCGRTTPW